MAGVVLLVDVEKLVFWPWADWLVVEASEDEVVGALVEEVLWLLGADFVEVD